MASPTTPGQGLSTNPAAIFSVDFARDTFSDTPTAASQLANADFPGATAIWQRMCAKRRRLQQPDSARKSFRDAAVRKKKHSRTSLRPMHLAKISEEVENDIETLFHKVAAGHNADLSNKESQASQHCIPQKNIPGPQAVRDRLEMGKRKETADENLARMVTHHRAGSLAAVAMHQKRKREHDDDELVQFRIQMAKRQAFGGVNPFASQDAGEAEPQQSRSRPPKKAGLLPTPYWSRLPVPANASTRLGGALCRKCNLCSRGGLVVRKHFPRQQHHCKPQNLFHTSRHTTSPKGRVVTECRPQITLTQVTGGRPWPLTMASQQPQTRILTSRSIARSRSSAQPLLERVAALKLLCLVGDFVMDQVWQPLVAFVVDTAVSARKRRETLRHRRTTPRSIPSIRCPSPNMRDPIKASTEDAVKAYTGRRQSSILGQQHKVLKAGPQFCKYTPNDPRLFFGYLS